MPRRRFAPTRTLRSATWLWNRVRLYLRSAYHKYLSKSGFWHELGERHEPQKYQDLSKNTKPTSHSPLGMASIQQTSLLGRVKKSEMEKFIYL